MCQDCGCHPQHHHKEGHSREEAHPEGRAMKLAVAGKGGVGKTTVSALLAGALRTSGRKVLAIDADPNSNLLACMGYRQPQPPPLVEMKDLIGERTGVKPGSNGGLLKINPRVDDIPRKFAVDVGGIKVLVAGAVKRGGSGCYCPENAFVRALVAHLLLEKDSALILDTEAGIEHLSRGAVEAVDQLLIVAEPSRQSVDTAFRIRSLAEDLGLRRLAVIGNKTRNDADRSFLMKSLDGIKILGFLPNDERLREAELAGIPPSGASARVDDIIEKIVRALEDQNPSPSHPYSSSHSH